VVASVSTDEPRCLLWTTRERLADLAAGTRRETRTSSSREVIFGPNGGRRRLRFAGNASLHRTIAVSAKASISRRRYTTDLLSSSGVQRPPGTTSSWPDLRLRATAYMRVSLNTGIRRATLP
jgi:hypothetical protein